MYLIEELSSMCADGVISDDLFIIAIRLLLSVIGARIIVFHCCVFVVVHQHRCVITLTSVTSTSISIGGSIVSIIRIRLSGQPFLLRQCVSG